MDIKDKIKNEINARYYDHVNGLMLSRLRLILFVAIIIHIAFYGIDRIVFPSLAFTFLKVRLIDSVFALVVICISYFEGMKKHIVWLSDIGGSVFILGMGVFMFLTGGLTSRFYEGTNLVFLGYAFVNSFYIPHLVACVLLWIGYDEAIMLIGHSFNLSYFLWSNYFVGSTALFVCIMAIFYKKEHYKAFVRQEQLKISSEELKASSEELRISSEELARSNKELEQYAYVVSHDLQEPLRMVSSFCQKLDETYRHQLDNNAREYIHFAVDGANRMQELIKGLLSYARLGNKRDTKIKEVDLNHVVKTILHDLELVIKEKKAVIKVGQLPVVMADEVQIAQLFQNLLTNALKFKGERDPVIEVSVRKEGLWWEFAVSDNGIGIDEQHFAQLFVMFQRLHGRSEYPGTGIGLAMCKKIAENFGGRIWIASKTGVGTTFYFTLRGG